MSLVYGLHSRDVERLFGLLSRLPGPVKQLMVCGYLAWSRFRLARLKGPVRLTHYVTARCTRKCIYCFYAGKLSDDTKKELTLQENQAWVSTLPERIQVVSLTGGEPFLRPDLPELAEVYWRCNRTLKISINTNGDLPERAEKACLAILARTGLVLNLTVSVQAPEDLEPSSPVAETLHRFARLQRENPRISQVSGLTTVTRENLASLPLLSERIAGLLSRRFSRPPEIFHKLQFIRGIPGNVFAPPSAPLSDLTPPDFERLALSPAQQQQVIELSRSQMATTTYKLQALRQLLFLDAAAEVARRGGPVFDAGVPTRAT
jgi:hypothetical protein